MHRSQGDRPPIEGMATPAFRAVHQEFLRNFIERDEKGAACAVYHQGEKVVDLWGGYRCPTTGAPRTKQTLVTVFSVTNQMGYYLFDDPREKALRDACYRCLATMHQGSRRASSPQPVHRSRASGRAGGDRDRSRGPAGTV